MPICLDPSQRPPPVVLPSDVGRPPDSRPSFQGRFLTRRESVQFSELAAAMEAAPSFSGEESAALMGILRILVAGWTNLRGDTGAVIPYTADAVERLPDLLTDSELIWLVGALRRSAVLGERDLGKSESPSASVGGSTPAAGPAATGPTVAAGT